MDVHPCSSRIIPLQAISRNVVNHVVSPDLSKLQRVFVNKKLWSAQQCVCTACASRTRSNCAASHHATCTAGFRKD